MHKGGELSTVNMNYKQGLSLFMKCLDSLGQDKIPSIQCPQIEKERKKNGNNNMKLIDEFYKVA
ncbi:hypothetical protein FRX31_012832 [Thalictrum thalictroides]|uniref:Uncharacterized protein n=1 Tax=Thalictrum thalictroides TaxID=46969 RepID=A0A7J6WJP7_THATH|nr:hypothetical protein FRX31_012832 [Thalictrum thalictroides]